MPKIKLIQLAGSYGCGTQSFDAGKIYEVDYKMAYYLVHSQKVAVEVTDLEEKLLTEKKEVKPLLDSASLEPPVGTIKIAIIRLGGIGDTLVTAGFTVAIKRKYPDSFITLFIRDTKCAEILCNHPDINRVVIVGQKLWDKVIDEVIIPQGHDIIYDSRYMTKVIYKNPKGHEEEIKANEEFLKPYEDVFTVFPLKNNEIYRIGKLNSYDLALKSVGLEGSPDDMFIKLEKTDYDMLSLLENDAYVTVHNGSDIARQTKCWPTNYWNEVSRYLKKKGYKVIQLGNSLEEPIAGAIDMRGKATLKQTSAFINKAKFHIDSEGGLVHIARAMRTRSIVLFGPTSLEFFRYEENINIQTPFECKDCWWKTDMWWRDCPEGYPSPPSCMTELKPELVFDAIDEIEEIEPMNKRPDYDIKDLNEQFALSMILDESHYRAEPWQLARVETMMSQAKGKDVLEIGAGDGYCVEVLKRRGYNVVATEISKIRLERMKAKGIDAHYADVNNLPFPDNTFDTVFCGEVLEHIDSMGQGMKELERVCKPGGRIVVSLPVAKYHRGIKMHLWGIDLFPIQRDGKQDMIVLSFERINRE